LGNLALAQVTLYTGLAEHIVTPIAHEQLASVGTPPTVLKISLRVPEMSQNVRFFKGVFVDTDQLQFSGPSPGPQGKTVCSIIKSLVSQMFK
jgi:hypothetical protein